MEATLDKYLPRGGTFVDLGANEGYFTVLAANKIGATGRVVAIEPQLRLIPIIETNLRLNDLSWATVLNLAATDIPKLVTIYLSADMNTGATGQQNVAKYPLKTQHVTGLPLAEILDQQGISSVDLLKVDIEGGEYDALLGSRKIFEEGRVRAIALELHPSILKLQNRNQGDITDMLTQCGYHGDTSNGNAVWQRPIRLRD